MNIFLIKGKKRSGKDFFGDLLEQAIISNDESVLRISFADAVKDILCDTFDMELDELNEHKNNESIISINGKPVSNMRSIIQRFSTEGMQSVFGKSVWRDLLLNNLEECGAENVIITDWRFPHETITDAILIDITNESLVSTDTHISENLLNDQECDIYINNTDRPDLTNYVKMAMYAKS